jgi:hypothetical protein
VSPTRARAGGVEFRVDESSVHPVGAIESSWSNAFDLGRRYALAIRPTAVPEQSLAARTSLANEIALRCATETIEVAIAEAIEQFNVQSAAEDAVRPPTAIHPVYQDLRCLTVTRRQVDANKIELCLGVSWMTRLHRRPWIVTLARLALHWTAAPTAGPHEAKSCVRIVRELPMITALRSVTKVLRLSAGIGLLALGVSFVTSTWLLWALSFGSAVFVLATFFPAYWKMALQSHALPALDALLARALRQHVHHPEVPEPYRDKTGH